MIFYDAMTVNRIFVPTSPKDLWKE